MNISATCSVRMNSIYFPYNIDLWHLNVINITIMTKPLVRMRERFLSCLNVEKLNSDTRQDVFQYLTNTMIFF